MNPSIQRRDVLKAGLAIGLGLKGRSSVAAHQDDQASARPKEGDLLVRLHDAAKTPLTADDIPADAMPTAAWAMDPKDQTVRSGSRFNQVLLVRLDSERLAAETRSRAASGVVAYTSVCTHSGCDIDDWVGDQQLLSCSCHASIFDPKDGGRVVDGPAPRALPALPLKIVDGKLAVAQPFTARIGFDPGG